MNDLVFCFTNKNNTHKYCGKISAINTKDETRSILRCGAINKYFY